jgi:serine/threonine-protein kinase
MATVYLARQSGMRGFEREVALKLTHPHLREQAEWATELIEEAKLTAQIRHPNVVSVLDVADDPSGVFLVMDYVEGETFAGILKHAIATGSQVPTPIVLRILVDALAGLHAAHEAADRTGRSLGIVHRDFSPQNLLVGTDGVTRLADFGVAKAADRVGFTRTGLVKGKIGYMAPEQLRDQPIDRRTDVWAAGVVAWEGLAGKRLYPAGDRAATLLRIVTEEPPRIRSVRPDVPAALDEAIASALTLDPHARCPSADELRRKIAASAEIADLAQVRDYVNACVGEKLVERRRMVAVTREGEGNANGHGSDFEVKTQGTFSTGSAPTVPNPSVRRRPWLRFAAVTIFALVGAGYALHVRGRFKASPPTPPIAVQVAPPPASPSDSPPLSPGSDSPPIPEPRVSSSSIPQQGSAHVASVRSTRVGSPGITSTPASVRTSKPRPIPPAASSAQPAPSPPKLHANPYD